MTFLINMFDSVTLPNILAAIENQYVHFLWSHDVDQLFYISAHGECYLVLPKLKPLILGLVVGGENHEHTLLFSWTSDSIVVCAQSKAC